MVEGKNCSLLKPCSVDPHQHGTPRTLLFSLSSEILIVFYVGKNSLNYSHNTL